MILPDIGEKRSDTSRQLQDIRRSHTEGRNARRSENASIGQGGLRLYDSGGLTIDDGGLITMRGGGEMRISGGGGIISFHPNGKISGFFGTITNDFGSAHGVVAYTDTGASILRAYQGENSNFWALGDPDEPPTDGYLDAVNIRVNTFSGGFIHLNPDTGSIFAKVNTTDVATAIGVDAFDRVVKISSSRRYKQDIEDSTIDPGAVLRLRPRQWRYKDAVTERGDDAVVAHGLVAEEVADAGLDVAVLRDAEGRPESLDNQAITAGLVALVQRQQEQLDAQRQQIDDLVRRLTALEGN